MEAAWILESPDKERFCQPASDFESSTNRSVSLNYGGIFQDFRISLLVLITLIKADYMLTMRESYALTSLHII